LARCQGFGHKIPSLAHLCPLENDTINVLARFSKEISEKVDWDSKFPRCLTAREAIDELLEMLSPIASWQSFKIVTPGSMTHSMSKFEPGSPPKLLLLV
jgi:hypothetical protein